MRAIGRCAIKVEVLEGCVIYTSRCLLTTNKSLQTSVGKLQNVFKLMVSYFKLPPTKIYHC